MKKIIIISEDRYSKMIDSYDQAVEELEKLREQLGNLDVSSKVVELIGKTRESEEIRELQNASVLEDIFANYIDNRDYSEGIAETLEPISKLMKWLDDHIEDFPKELGDSVIGVLGDYEQQWFINGFRYAMGIVQA